MQPKVEEPPNRIYRVILASSMSGPTAPAIRTRADTMCKGPPIQFKRDGQIVGEIPHNVAAWRIEEEASGQP